jgi:fibronectin type 3 domain-containing protein
VTINSATVAGTSFSISGASFPLTLTPTQTATLTVEFDPTAAGAADGTLTLVSNSSTNSTAVVSLSGTDQAVSYVVNLTWNAPAGSTDPVAGYNVYRSPGGSSSYQLVSSVGSTQLASTDSSVQTGLTYNYVVESVDASGNESIPSNMLTVTVGGSGSGTSNAALTAVSCASSSLIGTATDACTVTLNAAAANGGLIVGLASNNSAVTVPASVTVAAGATSANFSASVSSVSTAQAATLTATAGSVAETVALQLNAVVPMLSVNATNVAFGDVDLNSPADQSVTLSSTGGAPVTVSAAAISGTGFSISGATFPLTLSPNQTVTLSVQFDPTVAGAATGQLTINSNSSTNGTDAIALSGTGQALSYQVNLTWDAPASSTDPVASYNVYRSPSGGSTYQLVSSVSSTQLAYTDNNVQGGQAYNYIVESVDGSGNDSVPSNMASVAIP